MLPVLNMFINNGLNYVDIQNMLSYYSILRTVRGSFKVATLIYVGMWASLESRLYFQVIEINTIRSVKRWDQLPPKAT